MKPATAKIIRITAGRLTGREVVVLHEDPRSVRASIEIGTIMLPRRSPNGIRYFEEVARGSEAVA